MKRSPIQPGAKSLKRGSTFSSRGSGLKRSSLPRTVALDLPANPVESDLQQVGPAACHRPGPGTGMEVPMHTDPIPASRACEQCGGKRPKRAKRFCSRACSLASLADGKRLATKTCAECASQFRPTYSTQRFCSHPCALANYNATQRRTPTTCPYCGTAMDPGNPSKPRRTCGASACTAEAKAASKRGERNPMKDPATRAKVSATSAASRNALDSDIPGERRVKCSRPGCTQQVRATTGLYCSPRCHFDDRGRRGGRREQRYHRCFVCRDVFAWNGTGKGACCSRACSATLGSRQARVEVVDVVVLRGFRKVDWLATRLSECSHPECKKRAVHRHHVVFEQHVIRAHGDRWDPANALILCWQHHADTHYRRDFPVAALPAAALDFAVALLGPPAAYEYFRRRYAGVESDPRTAAWIAGES